MRGFTLVELIVSIGIFVLMTTLLVAKYGNFNQSVLLTNLVYDVALSVRTAQTFGLSVTKSDATSGNSQFQYPYGVHFSTAAGEDAKVILFADTNPINSPDNIYTTGDSVVSVYNISRGATISSLCTGSNDTSCTPTSNLTVSFKRPDPSAIICPSSAGSPSCIGAGYAKVTIRGTNSETRSVEIWQNGQITILQ